MKEKSEEAAVKAGEAIFERVWAQVESLVLAGKRFPGEIFWLNGAPGAGKGTQSAFIREHAQIESETVVMSDLLSGPEFQAIKDTGKLVGDEDVLGVLLTYILKRGFSDKLLVDGYPRTVEQAACVRCLAEKINELGGNAAFRVVFLNVDKGVSIERQLSRGKKAQAAGQAVRKTDLDSEAAGVRYQTFMDQTSPAMNYMRGVFEYIDVDASGDVDGVKAAIAQKLG